METHPFLIKQGITRLIEYTEPINEINKYLESKGIVLPQELITDLYSVMPIVICGNEKSNYQEITIKNGEIKKEELISEKVSYSELLFDKYYQYIEHLREEAKYDEAFNKVKKKWDIPLNDNWDFFSYLSINKMSVYLPYYIKHPELIKDIESLCSLVKLRPNVEEEFWPVAAYLLFGELMFDQTGELLFLLQKPMRIFRIVENGRYKLFLELFPSLNKYDWSNIYYLLKEITKDGLLTSKNSEILVGNLGIYIKELPNDLSQVLVYPVDHQVNNLALWKKEYRSVRRYLNDLYKENFRPRDKIIDEINIAKMKKIRDAEKKGTKVDNKLFKKIAMEIMDEFPERFDPDYPLSEDAVRKIYERETEKRRY